MADRYLLESGAPDGYLNEDGSGVLLLEAPPGVPGGQVITSARGTLTKSVTKALVGIALTVSAGIVTPVGENSVLLVGSAATSAVGSVVQSQDAELFGEELACSQGTFRTRLIINASTGISTPNSFVPMVGQFLTGDQGLVYPSVLTGSDLSVPVVTQVITSDTGTVGVPMERALTGVFSTSAHGTVTPGLRPTDITSQLITSAPGIATPLGNDVTVSISLGTPITSAQGFVNPNLITGQASTSAAGTLVYETERALTGLALTSGIGTVQANQEADDTFILSDSGLMSSEVAMPLMGSASTTGTGILSITSDLFVALTGSESVGAAGTIIYTPLVNLFGEDATVETGNVSTPAAVELVGLEITSAQGTIFTTNDRSIALIGTEATCAIGSVVANPRLNMNGAFLTSASGIVSFTTDFTRQLLGQSATLAAGTMVPLADRTIMLTGQEMTAQEGLIFANVDGAVRMLGESMTAYQGDVIAPNVVALTGLEILSIQGSLSHPASKSFELTGQEATFFHGTMTASGAEAGTPSGSNEGCHIVSRVAQEGCGIVSEVAQERSDSASGIATESNTNEA